MDSHREIMTMLSLRQMFARYDIVIDYVMAQSEVMMLTMLSRLAILTGPYPHAAILPSVSQ